MNVMLAYVFLAFAVLLIPYEVTTIYKNVLYKGKADHKGMPKPVLVFIAILGIEALYLIYLYFTKIA